jgi:rare lipoprotein A
LDRWAVGWLPANSGFFFPLETAACRRARIPPKACDAKNAEESPPMAYPCHAQTPAERRAALARLVEQPRPGARRRAIRAAATGAVLGLSVLTMGCAQSAEGVDQPVASAAADQLRPVGAPQVGTASYYARHFTGRRMANGGRFDPHSDTVAHRTLPFGTRVRVTNLHNGLSATGVVLDRGPWTRGRIVDLSPRIARNLDMMRSGIARVEIVPVVEVAEARD